MNILIRAFLLMLMVLFNSVEANAKLEVRGKPTEKSMIYVNNQPILPFCFSPWILYLEGYRYSKKPINLSQCLKQADIWKKTYDPVTEKNATISNVQTIDSYFEDNSFAHETLFWGNKSQWNELKKKYDDIEENIQKYDYHVAAIKNHNTAIIQFSYYSGGARGTLSALIEINMDEKHDTINNGQFYADYNQSYSSLHLDCIKKLRYLNNQLQLKRNVAIADLVNLLNNKEVVHHKETEPYKHYVACKDEKAGEIVEIENSLSQLSFDKTWLKSGNEGNPDWETCLKNYVLNEHNKGKSLIIKAKDFEQFKQVYQQACPMVK
ncbi:MAG: hypothetical protein ACOYK8_00395 [Alphaproteobacteria bacterium]